MYVNITILNVSFILTQEINWDNRVYQKQFSIKRFFKGLFIEEWKELREPIRYGKASVNKQHRRWFTISRSEELRGEKYYWNLMEDRCHGRDLVRANRKETVQWAPGNNCQKWQLSREEAKSVNRQTSLSILWSLMSTNKWPSTNK